MLGRVCVSGGLCHWLPVLVTVSVGCIPKAQPRHVAAARWGCVDLRISSFLACAPIPGSASRAYTRVWVSESVCLPRRWLLGRLYLPLRKLVAREEGGRSPLFQSSQDSNPGPCLLSPQPSHITSVGASPSHWHEPPQRAFQKIHDGIFEQLPRAGVQIFLL